MKPVGNALFLSLVSACQTWLKLPGVTGTSWQGMYKKLIWFYSDWNVTNLS